MPSLMGTAEFVQLHMLKHFYLATVVNAVGGNNGELPAEYFFVHSYQ